MEKTPPEASWPGRGLPVDCLDQASCFETLRAYGGRLFCLDRHVERLAGSCKGLGRSLPLSKDELKEWVEEGLRESGLRNALLRLTLFWKTPGEGALVVMLREFVSHPSEWYRRGTSLKTAAAKRGNLRAESPEVKAGQYVSGILSVLDSARRPSHEMIFLQEAGAVVEGTISNIFVVGGAEFGEGAVELLTPAVYSGILKGVTRDVVIQLARRKGIKVGETLLTRHDVYNARESFITNTSSEVLPVVQVDGRKIGDGRPGPVTRALREEFKKYVYAENSKGPHQRL